MHTEAELTAAIDKMAEEQNVDKLDLISELQTAAAKTGDEETLETLIEIKRGVIAARFGL